MRFEFGLDASCHDATSVVTVGTFDGVHLGHQAIIRRLRRSAKRCGGLSTLITFDPHPGDVVRGQLTPLLTTVNEKAAILESLGLQRLVVIPFTSAFAALSAVDFVQSVLVEQIGLKQVIVGYDHGFGREREGDTALLRTMGAQYGFGVEVIKAQEVSAKVVSSRKIRDLLYRQGDVTGAEDMLGRPYALTGTVTIGQGRGRTIGFPTANLRVNNPSKLIPRNGVYAVRACVAQVHMGGMMNIGVRPTIEESQDRHLEVHLFDYSGDLYSQSLTIEFVDRIRDEVRFESFDALASQLARDEAICRDLVA